MSALTPQGHIPQTQVVNVIVCVIQMMFTKMSWLHFPKIEREMIYFVSSLLEVLKGKIIKFEYLLRDKAGENTIKLRTLCQKQKIELEYKAPGSPRPNGLVENEINLICERAITMMVHDNTKKKPQVKLWSEVVYCSCFLENLILKVDKNEPSMED